MADETNNQMEFRNIAIQLSQMVQQFNKLGKGIDRVGAGLESIGSQVTRSSQQMADASRQFVETSNSQFNSLVNLTKQGKQLNQVIQSMGKNFSLLRDFFQAIKVSIFQEFLGIGKGGTKSIVTGFFHGLDIDNKIKESIKSTMDAFKGKVSISTMKKAGDEIMPAISLLIGNFVDSFKKLFQSNFKLEMGTGRMKHMWNTILESFVFIKDIINMSFKSDVDKITQTFKPTGNILNKIFGPNGTIDRGFAWLRPGGLFDKTMTPIAKTFINISKFPFKKLQGMFSVFGKTKDQFDLGKIIAGDPKNRAEWLKTFSKGSGLAGGITRFAGGVEEGGFFGGMSAALGVGAVAAAAILAAVLGIVVIIGKLVSEMFKLDKVTTNFRMSMGFVSRYSNDITLSSAAAARDWSMFGSNVETSLEAFSAIAEQMGTTDVATSGIVSNFNLINKQLGVSMSTSAQFLHSMSLIGRTTYQASKDTLLMVARMSQAAMTPLSGVMDDISNTTTNFYSLIRKSPLAMIQAAVNAKRLGTNLSQTAQSMTSVLDFTSSITKEMEASVLLGKSMNLQRLRELSYQGDFNGAQEETLKILKDINFEQLDYYQKESVASALGRSSADLGTMLAQRKSLLALGKSTLTIQKEQYEQELKTKANQAILTQLGNAWSSLWVDMAPGITEVLNIIRSMIPYVTGLVDIFKVLIDYERITINLASIKSNLIKNILLHPLTNPTTGLLDTTKAAGKDIGNIIGKHISGGAGGYSKDYDIKNIPPNREDYTSQLNKQTSDMIASNNDSERRHQELLKSNESVASSVDALHTSLKHGAITADVRLDSQRLDSAVGRRLAYTGTLT